MTWQADRLNPLKRAAKARPVVAWDTEGVGGPGGFICGSVVTDNSEDVFTDPSDMLAYLTAPQRRGAWLWSHNLEYDLAVLTGGDLTMLSCLFIHSRLLWAETQDAHRHKWRFCDSLNIFPAMTVAALGDLVGLPKLQTPEALLVAANNGRTAPANTRSEMHLIQEYCLRDAMIVHRAVTALQATLNGLGGQLQATIAGCAMDLFRRRYQTRSFRVPDRAVNLLARSAYYGGRVEPYRLGRVSSVNGYDVNSLYPAAQVSAELPDPDYMTVDVAPSSLVSRLKYPGFSYVTADIPEASVPCLPVKTMQGLFFPTGLVTGAWTHNELRHALQCGVTLTDCHWSMFSTRTVQPFDKYVNDLYTLKAAAGEEGTAARAVYKLLLNSLYGRWGVTGDNSLAALAPIRDTEDLQNHQGAELTVICDAPYLLTPLGGDHQPAYSQVLWAATITAEARTRMFSLLSAASDELIYTDTDSVWLNGRLAELEGLGGLRQTHAGVDLWVVSPKEYAVFHNESLVSAHVKGVPEALRLLYLAGKGVTFDSPAGIRELARRHVAPGEWIERLRRRGYAIPKRAPLGQLSGCSPYLLTRAWQTRSWLRWWSCFRNRQGKHQYSSLRDLLTDGDGAVAVNLHQSGGLQ